MEHFFLGGRKLGVLNGVYSPADDSFLLSESIVAGKNASVLDLGCGTGIQGITALLNEAKECVFADVNALAVENARQNCSLLGLEGKAEFVESNLFEKISGKFDLVLFNAPYVVTEKIVSGDTDGGKHGRVVLDRFLDQFPAFLEQGGRCFFLQSDLNGVVETEKKLVQKHFHYRIAGQKRLFFENILVIECWRQ